MHLGIGTDVSDLPAAWHNKGVVDVLHAVGAAGTGADTRSVVELLPATRPMIVPRAPKAHDKNISAKVKMTQTFPIPVSYLLPVAEALARTSSHMENFSRFLHTKLPQGFPVAFELPIVPAVTAKVQFMSAKVTKQDPALFHVPDEYSDHTSAVTHGTYFTTLGRVGEEQVGPTGQSIDDQLQNAEAAGTSSHTAQIAAAGSGAEKEK
jgi:hypothetical protein